MNVNEKDEEFFSTKNCKKIGPSILYSEDNIKITVCRPEVKSKGFFSANYVIYSIITEPFNWDITRRYSDFYWLRNILVKVFPNIIVPPIPTKTNSRSFEYLFL